MCGITGFLRYGRAPSDPIDNIHRMTSTLVHRGPDDEGYWSDEAAGMYLGHRRLSIIDISREGHQPMVSSSDKYVIVLNGEIYNYPDLRGKLESEGFRFRGKSDTEVILAGFDSWGIEKTLEQMVGMYAFALWDRHSRTLRLVRDRLGEKPLYYGWVSETFLFGSELKSMVEYSEWEGEVDRGSLALLMRHNCIPAPHCIYKGIYKLPPASVLTLRYGDGIDKTISPTPYWSIRDVAKRGAKDSFEGDESSIIDGLDSTLRSSIEGQMLSDVPLGAFLSGGIDSSLVVALMQACSARPVRSFSIGFHEVDYDEAPHAKAVANHLGTDHVEFYVTSKEARDLVPQLPAMYDEPFSDSSQIPMYMVAKLARQHVTVGLSGDGGDELFGGYNRHIWGERVWRQSKRWPLSVRRTAAAGLRRCSPRAINSLCRRIDPVLPSSLSHRVPGDKIQKLAGVLDADSRADLYERLVSHWRHPSEVVIGANNLETHVSRGEIWDDVPSYSEGMMLLDTLTFLPDDIMVKVDRASMAASLEARAPFLDHRVVEYAWRIPMEMKIQDGVGKSILRKLLYRYVPENIVARPKMGFGMPIDDWLRGPLREWAESLLDERRLRNEGYFNPEPIHKKWKEHIAGSQNWQHHIWDVLMFQSWRDNWKGMS